MVSLRFKQWLKKRLHAAKLRKCLLSMHQYMVPVAGFLQKKVNGYLADHTKNKFNSYMARNKFCINAKLPKLTDTREILTKPNWGHTNPLKKRLSIIQINAKRCLPVFYANSLIYSELQFFVGNVLTSLKFKFCNSPIFDDDEPKQMSSLSPKTKQMAYSLTKLYC